MKLPTPASNQARALGLASRRPEQRAEAEQAIRDMGADRIPFLFQVFDEQRRLFLRQSKVHTALCLLMMAVLACSFMLMYGRWPHSPVVQWGSKLAFIPVSLVCLRMFTLKPAPLQTNARALLTRLADKRDLGMLIDLLVTVQGGSAKDLDTALARILSELQASDADLLLPKHRTILANVLPYRHLTGPEGTAFTIALLKALQQIGDGSFVEPVTAIARTAEHGWKNRVRMAALECLPYLQAFNKQEQIAGTLVRAAEAPPDEQANALLVRPAAASPSNPAVLLRPTIGEDAE